MYGVPTPNQGIFSSIILQTPCAMELREKNLFPPLKSWLNDQGFKVYGEVYGCDVVAIKGRLQISYELKMSLNKKVIHQAISHRYRSNYCYVVVPTNPRKSSIEKCKKYRVGIIQVLGSEVKELLAPYFFTYNPRYRMDFGDMPESTEAGIPNLKGLGPGQLCLERIKDYLKDHPNAKWPEIFENVENHYSSYKSLQSSMSNWQGFTLNDFSL